LLYLQAELTDLEQGLKYAADADVQSPEAARRYTTKHWQLLKESQQEEHDEQYKKIIQIRTVLKEYSMRHTQSPEPVLLSNSLT
jgi:hypothetical protein